MSYFILTHGLRERLRASAPARVVNVASDAHKGRKLDFNDCNRLTITASMFMAVPSFATFFSRANWHGDGMALALPLTRCIPDLYQRGSAMRVVDYFLGSPRRQNVCHLTGERRRDHHLSGIFGGSAQSSGLYFYKCKPATPTKEAQDDDVARRLWQESEKIAGISY